MITAEVAPSVTLRIAAPEGLRDEPDERLPSVDVSAVPGARVVLRRGLLGPELRVRAACVVAPSDRWAPGLEELVLGRATGLASAGLDGAAERWEAGPITGGPGRFDQTVIGRARDREVAVLRHALVFTGEDHDALLCSVACAGAGGCQEIAASVELDGAVVGPPPPSLLVRAALFAAEAPYEVMAGALVASALVVGVLVRSRPKVPGRRHFP